MRKLARLVSALALCGLTGLGLAACGSSGAKIAMRISTTMNTRLTIATRSSRKRRQNSSSGERAAMSC